MYKIKVKVANSPRQTSVVLVADDGKEYELPVTKMVVTASADNITTANLTVIVGEVVGEISTVGGFADDAFSNLVEILQVADEAKARLAKATQKIRKVKSK